MIGAVSTRYALRSLFRHTRRTVLSMIGIGVGCGIGLLGGSWIGGAREMQIRAIAESGAGHLRVVASGWTETRENSMRLENWQDVLRDIEALPDLKAASVRAKVNGLLAFGNRTAGVEILGVEPARERAANRVIRKAEIEGRYLNPEDEGNVVIGGVLAERLDVELEDPLYVTVSGRDAIQSVMLTIVGLVHSGSTDIDASICHVTLDEVERLSGYSGVAEISILLNDYQEIEATREKLAAEIGPGNEVITWKEVNPGMAAGIESDRAFMRGLFGIIIILVSLGIASAQLTAVLERRSELAVLSALGMRSRQIVSIVMLEALMVGLGGAVVALVLGGSAAYWLATKGVSMAFIMGEEVSFGDILLDPYIYGSFGIWIVWQALAVSTIATIVATVYPAWTATKVDPAEALRKV